MASTLLEVTQEDLDLFIIAFTALVNSKEMDALQAAVQDEAVAKLDLLLQLQGLLVVQQLK